MPKIIVNYITKDDKTKIHKSPVWADLPIAICNLYDEFKDPLIVPTGGIPLIVEKEEYLKTRRKFFLDVNEDGTVKEVDEQAARFVFYYPKDTDVSKLRYVNGNIIRINEEG